MTSDGANNVGGMVAQRWALIAHVGTFDEDAWSQRLPDGMSAREAVANLVRLYGTVLGSTEEDAGEGAGVTDDGAALVDELDRRADLVEAKLTGIGDDRWDLSVQAFEAVGGTARMAIHRLMAELVFLALRLGAPVPPPAREAAAAAVAWRVADNIEVPTEVVLEDCQEDAKQLILGAGAPEVTVHTDSLTFVRTAFGVADDDSEIQVDGSSEAVDAFRRSFTGAWNAFDRDTDDTDTDTDTERDTDPA